MKTQSYSDGNVRETMSSMRLHTTYSSRTNRWTKTSHERLLPLPGWCYVWKRCSMEICVGSWLYLFCFI